MPEKGRVIRLMIIEAYSIGLISNNCLVSTFQRVTNKSKGETEIRAQNLCASTGANNVKRMSW